MELEQHMVNESRREGIIRLLANLPGNTCDRPPTDKFGYVPRHASVVPDTDGDDGHHYFRLPSLEVQCGLRHRFCSPGAGHGHGASTNGHTDRTSAEVQVRHYFATLCAHYWGIRDTAAVKYFHPPAVSLDWRLTPADAGRGCLQLESDPAPQLPAQMRS